VSVGDRIKILEFFNKAAELMSFDAQRLSHILQEPWEQEA